MGVVRMNAVSMGTASMRTKSMGGDEPPMNPLVFYDRLVTDGKAYINLGRKASKVMSIRLKYTPVGSGEQYIIGAKEANSSWHLFGTNNDTFSFFWGSNFSSGQMSYLSQNEFDILISTTESNATYHRFEGVYPDYSVTFDKRGELFNYNLYIFCANDGSTPNYRCSAGTSIRSMVITDNSQISMMLYPCTFMGEAGLYDIINGVFYGNANSEGSFSVEGEGREYVLFDKLITDGRAYIDTGFTFTSTDAQFKVVSKRGGMAGWTSLLGNGVDGDTELYWESNVGRYWAGYLNGIGAIYQSGFAGTGYETELTFVENGNSATATMVNLSTMEQSVKTYSHTPRFTDRSIYLFGTNGQNGVARIAFAKSYIKSFSASENGVVKVDMRPAWYEGQFGMWDMVRGAFYPNANSVGQFSVE